MTNQLRTLADAEALKRVNRMEIVDGKEAVGFRNGFIAGRTSVTREQIAAALAEPGAMGAQNHDLRQADQVLALLNGNTDDPR